MNNPHRKVRIKPYCWDRGRPTATDGFMLDDRRVQIFITEDDAVNLSNTIIDLIEGKENR